LTHIAASLPNSGCVLQLFCGKVDLRVLTGDMLDIRLATAPRTT